MITYKHLLLFLIVIFILPFAQLGNQAVEKPIYAYRQPIEDTGTHLFDKFEDAPVLDFLGKTFDDIEQVLGEPDEQGYSSWLGPHNFILYRNREGFIRFCSPKNIENKIAITIILGPGQELYGISAGMLFTEIKAVLGDPDFGPEFGINNLYYMDYYLGELNLQTPDVFISFSATEINGPTQNIFIKWEAYDYKEKDQLQAARCNIYEKI